jgi:hypothetical protein
VSVWKRAWAAEVHERKHQCEGTVDEGAVDDAVFVVESVAQQRRRLLTKNVNPKVVSELLGHATIAITLDTYSHVLPTVQESAAAAMEDALT